MRAGIISVFVDYYRRGRKHCLSMQPQADAILVNVRQRKVATPTVWPIATATTHASDANPEQIPA